MEKRMIKTPTKAKNASNSSLLASILYQVVSSATFLFIPRVMQSSLQINH
jgi:hypothetical protein